MLLAGGSLLAGGDPLDGARVGRDRPRRSCCLVGAVRLGWLLGGSGGAIGTALALAAMPIVWRLTPTLRIDLPQTAGVIAVLLVVWRPTMGRWALGGVLFGLTVLVKESVLPMALLPLALLGTEPLRRVVGLGTVFLVTALLTAGWWWVLVWFGTGAVFPLNALDVVEAREVGRALGLGRTTIAFGGVAVLGWLAMLGRARADPGARLMVVAAACLLPAAAYAATHGLDSRNYAALAVLSSVAIGVAGAMAVRWLSARVGGGRHAACRPDRRARPVRRGRRVRRPASGRGPAAGGRRGRPHDVAARQHGRRRPDRDDLPRSRGDGAGPVRLRQGGEPLPGARRPRRTTRRPSCGWACAIGSCSGTAGPTGRARWRTRRCATSCRPGRTRSTRRNSSRPWTRDRSRVSSGSTSIDRAGDHAEVFSVDPADLDLRPDVVPTTMSADAALAWLDLAAAGGRRGLRRPRGCWRRRPSSPAIPCPPYSPGWGSVLSPRSREDRSS